MKNWWIWLSLLGVVTGLIIAWILRRRPDPKEVLYDIGTEVKAAAAAAETAKIEAEFDKNEALLFVCLAHEVALGELEKEEEREVELLKDNPIELSRFLVRAGRRRNAAQGPQ